VTVALVIQDKRRGSKVEAVKKAVRMPFRLASGIEEEAPFLKGDDVAAMKKISQAINIGNSFIMHSAMSNTEEKGRIDSSKNLSSFC
jgi:hypothetical protein